MDTQNVNIFLAFGAGILSFFTPCCLPIFPSFLSYVTGVSLGDLKASTKESRGRVLKHSLAFFAGFSAIYVALGLTASALGSFFVSGRSWLPIVGGVWVVLMGLVLLGVIKLPFLMRDRRVQLANKPQGYLGSVVVGLSYAAGWTPCVGPILTSVLALAANNPGQGGLLLLAYSIGFAAPFIVLAYTIGSVKWLTRHTVTIERVGGGLMVVMGLLLATGYMEKVSAWLLSLSSWKGI